VTREVNVNAGKFTVTLEVPEHSTGDCHIRAAIDGREQFALGAHDLTIVRRPKTDDGVRESKTTRPTRTR
jgi:hypothetical protein